MKDNKRTVGLVYQSNAKLKVVGYVRISSRTQENGYGKDLQKKAIDDHCQINAGLELVKTFTDSAVSGTEKGLEGRKAFFELLSFCSENEIKYILVYDISRVWRDDLVAATLKREMKKRSIELISIQEPEYSLSDDSPSSQLVAGIMENVAAFQRSSLVLKMNNGRESKFLKGGFGGGGLPLGLSTSGKNLIIIESEMNIVRFIYRKKRAGWSLYKIAKTLRENNVVGKRGGRIEIHTIKKVLRCKAYRGFLRYSGKLYPSALGKVL